MPSSLYGNKFDFVNRFGGPYSSSAYGRSASAEQSSHKTKWTPPIMTVTTYPPLFSWDKIPFIFLQLHPADATTAPAAPHRSLLSLSRKTKFVVIEIGRPSLVRSLSNRKPRKRFVPSLSLSLSLSLCPFRSFLFFLRGNRD